MISSGDASLVATLYRKASRLEEQATALEFDAQDLRHQAREIENRYEFQGPCVGCERHRSCTLAGTCAALEKCRHARELAGVTA